MLINGLTVKQCNTISCVVHCYLHYNILVLR